MTDQETSSTRGSERATLVVCTLFLVVLAGAAHLYFKGQLEEAEATAKAAADAATKAQGVYDRFRESQRIQEAQRWVLDQKAKAEGGDR